MKHRTYCAVTPPVRDSRSHNTSQRLYSEREQIFFIKFGRGGKKSLFPDVGESKNSDVKNKIAL